MKDRTAKGIGRVNLAVGLVMLVVCYAILVAGMVMMIIVNEPDAWQAYFRDSAFRFL